LGGLVEGISIIIVALFIMLITSWADHIKDTRFVSLQSLIREESVPVIRGKFGATQSVSVWDLVVGDVILLSAGTRVPADCLIIECADVEVSQKGQVAFSENKQMATAP
jgi:P-type E1-E2 ATPase